MMSVLKVGFYRELLSFGYNVWACDADAVRFSCPLLAKALGKLLTLHALLCTHHCHARTVMHAPLPTYCRRTATRYRPLSVLAICLA